MRQFTISLLALLAMLSISNQALARGSARVESSKDSQGHKNAKTLTVTSQNTQNYTDEQKAPTEDLRNVEKVMNKAHSELKKQPAAQHCGVPSSEHQTPEARIHAASTCFISKIAEDTYLVKDPKGQVPPFVLGALAPTRFLLKDAKRYCRDGIEELPSRDQLQALQRAMTRREKRSAEEEEDVYDPSLIPGIENTNLLCRTRHPDYPRFVYCFEGATGKVTDIHSYFMSRVRCASIPPKKYR